MVNIFVFSLFILSIGYSNAKATTKDHIFEAVARAVIRDAIKKCDAEFGPIPDLLSMVREGEYLDDEKFQKIIHCSYKASGYAYDDGRVNIDKVAELFPEEVHEVLKECDKEVGNDAVETTYKFYKCFQNNSPVNIGLSPDDC